MARNNHQAKAPRTGLTDADKRWIKALVNRVADNLYESLKPRENPPAKAIGFYIPTGDET